MKYANMNRIRIFYLGVWTFFLLVSLWMYAKEGRYLHLMEMELSTVEETYTVSVRAGERQIYACSVEEDVEIERLRRKLGSQNILQVTGHQTADGTGRPDSVGKLVFLYDDDTEEGIWDIIDSDGVARIRYGEQVWKNTGKILYLVIPFLYGLLVAGLCLFPGRNDKRYAGAILEKLAQTEDGRQALKTGLRWMRKNGLYWEALSCLVFLCTIAESLYIVYKMSHSEILLGSYGSLLIPIILLVMLVVVGYMVQIAYAKQNLHILTKEMRPLTAAAAYLMEVSRGGMSRSRRRILLHNAAVGLSRAGLYELALETETYCGAGRESDLWKYIHGNLKFHCLLHLGREEEAARESNQLKELLHRFPRLLRQRIVRESMPGIKIMEAVMEEDEKKVLIYVEMLLEQGADDYFLIPARLWEARLYEAKGNVEKLREISSYLLQFSPENAAVKWAMQYGECTYAEPKGLWKTGLVDKVLCGLLMALAGICLTFLAAACMELSKPMGGEAGEAGKKDGILNEAVDKTTADRAAGSKSGSESDMETEKETADLSMVPEEDNRLISTEHYDFQLPPKWDGLAVTKVREDGSVVVNERDSYEIMGGGELFGITMVQGGEYINLPDYEIWGYDDEWVYVMWRPTDVAFYPEDEKIRERYGWMSQDLDRIRETFRIKAEGARYDGDEFVFPDSGTCYLDESCLWNLSEEGLRIARNEIYARHGRRFRDEALQDYFDRCSWYEGTFAPEEFPEGILNEFERANILLMQQ